ncbi:hypothetical protein COU57_04590 [Candidatus Pacearchaeota archaeon CG10_big_fil_rev_8_21_14_0_10_32_14]|nr:MAG: hypothetical protein COU57_04590 [Candidatus Pacearchaeota archaeon CG10_big_fil_rev_8_21_14_0_10_32_14]
MNREKIGIFLAYFMQLLILLSVIISFFSGEYFYLVGAIIALIITFLPSIISKKWNITLPWILNLLIALSLYLYAGGLIFGYYEAFSPFYDSFHHFVGSVTVALLGFTSVIIINHQSNLKLNKRHITLFIVIFTMAIGSFWEIFEFFFDMFFNGHSQPSLTDTIYDMIFNFFGGMFIAILTNINYEPMKNNIIKKTTC